MTETTYTGTQKARMIMHEPRIYKQIIKHQGITREALGEVLPLVPAKVIDHALDGLALGLWVYASETKAGAAERLFAESPDEDEEHLVPGWQEYKRPGYHLLSGVAEQVRIQSTDVMGLVVAA